MANWFDIPSPYDRLERARVVVIPAPYEGTVSWGKGAGQGPAAILAASPYLERYESVLRREPYRVGIHVRAPLKLPADPAGAIAAVETAVAETLASGRRPVVLGGEHTVTLGAVRACRDRYPDLSVLQLDAHADLREEYEGTPFSHACVMRRVAELPVPFVQAGLRAFSEEERDWLAARGQVPIHAREIVRSSAWIERCLAPLSGHVYLTVDVDVLDPSEMPATGTPEPGGIGYHHLLDLVLGLAASGKEVVGFDLVELAPLPGLHHPQYLAASLVYVMIGAFFPA